MRPFPARKGPLESAIVARIRDVLRASGWTLVEKTHGDAAMAGWPDLMAFRPDDRPWGRVQWIEAKRPGGRLTRDQRGRFASWEAAGLGVWILTGPAELGLLDRPPNWRAWAGVACAECGKTVKRGLARATDGAMLCRWCAARETK